LLREGHGAGIYDASLEAPLTAALIAPTPSGANLNFLYPPPAAVLVMPLTLLPLSAVPTPLLALDVQRGGMPGQPGARISAILKGKVEQVRSDLLAACLSLLLQRFSAD